MNLILFSAIYLFLCNWFQVLSFLSVIIGPKYKTSSIDDKWIKSIVKKKTSLTLLDITIFHDKKMYGMMAGLPFWPKMILSEGLYKAFNKDEMEWVILHEAAHCVLWHNLQALLIEMVFFILGIYVILNNSWSLFMTGLLAMGLSVICVQILRWGIEYFADKFSISRVDNPNGVITAQEKFKKAYKSNFLNSDSSIFRFLLHWNIYPAMRIKMAKDRMTVK